MKATTEKINPLYADTELRVIAKDAARQIRGLAHNPRGGDQYSDWQIIEAVALSVEASQRERIAKELEQYRGLHETTSDCLCKDSVVDALAVAAHRVRHPELYDEATGISKWAFERGLVTHKPSSEQTSKSDSHEALVSALRRIYEHYLVHSAACIAAPIGDCICGASEALLIARAALQAASVSPKEKAIK